MKRARMHGFVVFDHMDKWEESVERVAQWVRDGKLGYSEEFLDGLESCPDALAALYREGNFGKRIIRL